MSFLQTRNIGNNADIDIKSEALLCENPKNPVTKMLP